MKINFLIILVISVALCFSGCKLGSSDKVDEENKNGNSQEITYGGECCRQFTEGEIIKIEDNNTIVIEITLNQGGYKIGDRIRVKYDSMVGKKESIPEMGDVVRIAYWGANINSEDEMDLITVLDAIRYVEEHSDRTSEENNENATCMRIIEGEVIEIINDNTILLEITKERGGYSIGDNVKVEYEKYIEENENSDISTDNSIVPDVGDIVGVQFSESEKNREEGIDLVVVGEVYKYVEQYLCR